MDEVASQAMIALDRARSASRTKLHQEAVGESQKLPGEVDESETGSITLDQARSELARRLARPKWGCAKVRLVPDRESVVALMTGPRALVQARTDPE